MKRAFVKKTMAVALAATMILGSTMTVFATEDTQQTTDTIPGTGEVEGVVDTSVFDVVVPQITEGTYNFRLDPQGLIEKTGTASEEDGRTDTYVTHEGHENAEFAVDTTMYFANSVTTDDTPITLYTNTSSVASFENHSTTKVDVTVIVEVKDADGIAISEDNTFANDTTASMYLELNNTLTGDSEKSAVVDNKTNIATLTTTLDALEASNFKPKYENGEYLYELIENPTIGEGAKFSYVLTGAANAKGTWTDEQKEAAPAIEVTWKIGVHKEGTPSTITTTSYTMADSTPVEITVTLGTQDYVATGIKAITYANSSGTEKTLATENYTFTDNKITLTADYIDSVLNAGVTSREYTIVFNDVDETEVIITLTKSE